MEYKVYQIHLTDAEYDMVNANGHYSVEKQVLKLDLGLSGDDMATLANTGFQKNYYTHVSNITANDLDEVFRIGNNGDETKIERLADMFSVSVGDVIEDSNGVRNIVARFGFQTI